MSVQFSIKNESADKGPRIYVEASEFVGRDDLGFDSPGFELAAGESRVLSASPGIRWSITEVQS